MNKYLAKRAYEVVSKSDILYIASLAKEDKKKGNRIINASIGSLLNDDKTLNGVGLIKDSLAEHIDDDLSYPPTTGQYEYKAAVLRWLLKDRYEEISSIKKIAIGATLGGTGACYVSMGTFLDKEQTVLLPDPMWGNYKQIAKKCFISYDTYSLFTKDGKFNLDSIKAKIDEYKLKQDNILIIVNDPCQNPTGFCMSKEEYDGLFDLLNEESSTASITCLFDIAYIDCFTLGRKIHYVFTKSAEDNKFLPCFAFSCSKSFGAYGLRCGALIAMCSEEDTKKAVEASIGSLARGTYSCPNGPALHSIAKALSDSSTKEELSNQIEANSILLSKRCSRLLKALDDNRIEHYPFTKGFFITIKVLDAFKLSEELRSIHTYVVPISATEIRIAVSSLNDEEIPVLVSQIKKLA